MNENFIDKIFIINLNSSNEEIINKLSKIPFTSSVPYYILDAINGWEVVDDPSKCHYKFKIADWWEIDKSKVEDVKNPNNRFFTRPVTHGEAGCGLSHYNCIDIAYKEGCENILILEEDFVPLGKWPTAEMFQELPDDWSLLYLDRKQQWPDSKEKKVSSHVTEVGYTYNNHAYLVSRKGMKEVVSSPFLSNVIVSDEFFPAINGTSDREDAVKIFHNPEFKSYAFQGGFFNQTSNPSKNSLTEFNPKYLVKGEDSTAESYAILNDENWDDWCKKYIAPQILSKEYELIVDEPCSNVFTFPFFTKSFCEEIILLGEKKEWTTSRHEFYPTTDNLLEELGMEKIYNRIINEFVRPLAIWAWKLEGKSWDILRDESFIIKYTPEEQAHLGLHHDYSNITTLVNLNAGEFKGGGTYFPKYKTLVNPQEIGVMTLHPGNITHKHGARPVTEGTRYVVVSFIKNQDHVA